jgi:hypothetical protein
MTIYGYLQPFNEKEKKLMAELSLIAGVPSKAVTYYESLHAQSIRTGYYCQNSSKLSDDESAATSFEMG